MFQVKRFWQQNDFIEIHPMTILGITASMIPFPDHSQAPRNCFQTNMAKQSLGISTLAWQHRADTQMYVMHYPQKPLTYTKMADFTHFNDMPSGNACIIAIACYTGFNQEDSVILNQSAIQRGLFDVTKLFTIEEIEKKCDNASQEIICVPPENSNSMVKPKDQNYFKRKFGNYSMLDENGIIRKGMNVKKDDVIVGKVIIRTEKEEKISREVKIDASRIIQEGEEGIIDRVFVSWTPSGYRLVKIVIRKCMPITVGDKVASRAAQKGTCGMIFPQHDMPFTSSGLVPDVIINPHCIPSRMTISQLIEMVAGKVVCMTGEMEDVSPFTENSKIAAEQLTQKLGNLGFEKHGNEILYCGLTGEQMDSQIFIGVAHYQRLKHLVNNKIHARSRGPMTMLTRQPLEGRAKEGGLRLGEMERDALLSIGSTAFLRERMNECSDKFAADICGVCGIITASPTQCQSCGSDNVVRTALPYATKLLIQELNAMCIKIKVDPE